MEAVMAAPSTIGYTAILEAHEPADRGSAAPFRMKLCRGKGIHKAWTWIPPKPVGAERMRKVHVTEVDALADDFSWCPVITNMVAAQNAPILPLIFPSCSNATGLADRLRNVVETVEAIPLVDFIDDVFTLSQVYRHFFTCPASQDYHHALPSGLAVHSIEMAERVARTPFTSPNDRDLAIVYALFHDVGKILCYGKEGFTSSQELGHELAGVLLLKDPLDALEALRTPMELITETNES
ncbi:HD domain-containing protein [Dokdonella sp.]|uniref:HD domain-containing protein n=1 Tax=Dokdonella sp. TaxID=2291710 RepID=UPI0035275881